jgi:hypothetical protein
MAESLYRENGSRLLYFFNYTDPSKPQPWAWVVYSQDGQAIHTETTVGFPEAREAALEIVRDLLPADFAAYKRWQVTVKADRMKKLREAVHQAEKAFDIAVREWEEAAADAAKLA